MFGVLTKSEVRSQKSEVNPPLTPPKRGSRGFEQLSKNISPFPGGVARPNYFDKTRSGVSKTIPMQLDLLHFRLCRMAEITDQL
ncbi:hypothetical protein [Okeania sp. SIO1I7]|uniref:hypothetical protein n=1 Tax=Okeania sp. SIO1I7 TaxID=2607772 RepID=UPI0013F89058|nr:hypothetical protein [Okeania sp. SIO1I7]NET27376.1 hypothetical protein [Okeania sp. SIO1I7]